MVVYPTVSRKVAGSNPVSTAKTGKITIGCLPALDAGGCGFEPYFSDKLNAGMVKLVNTLDLESSIERCESSNLSSRTS